MRACECTVYISLTSFQHYTGQLVLLLSSHGCIAQHRCNALRPIIFLHLNGGHLALDSIAVNPIPAQSCFELIDIAVSLLRGFKAL